jgi:hypothetical protein
MDPGDGEGKLAVLLPQQSREGAPDVAIADDCQFQGSIVARENGSAMHGSGRTCYAFGHDS